MGPSTDAEWRTRKVIWMTKNGTIGVIGLGIMGGAIARNLLGGGWRVVGYDVHAATLSQAAKDGVDAAASAAEVARSASDIITSLPKPEAVIETAQAIAAAGAPRRVVLEVSTLALEDKASFAGILEAAGHIPLDCPLSGTGAQAKVKDLVVLASGPSAEISRLVPVFLGFARTHYDLGPFGNGTKMKFIANLLVAIHNVATAEAITLGRKAGLDAHQVVEVISAGVGTSRVFELRGPMMADGNYLPATMRNSTWKKDMTVIGEFASAVGCPVPMFATAAPLYEATLAMGLGDQDTGAVCTVLERLAGIAR
jgi:3-hydroxyisobutyrate dehydrogenase-like beta-hydroxyacid dehydrogenase